MIQPRREKSMMHSADQEGFPSRRDSYGNGYPDQPTYTITGLTPGVRYKIRLRARYNGTAGQFRFIGLNGSSGAIAVAGQVL